MTNTDITQETPVLTPANDWRPLAASARNVFICTAAITTILILLVPAAIFMLAADDATGLEYLAVAVAVVLLTGLASLVAYKRWLNTFWKLDEEALHVRRGKTWFKQICVPRSRVQHLDFERGPLERKYGLATLVVHTAGSQERAVRQSGLLLADAEYLRDVLVPKERRNAE